MTAAETVVTVTVDTPDGQAIDPGMLGFGALVAAVNVTMAGGDRRDQQAPTSRPG